MTTECGCTPGTYEDGWQEHRSDTCEAQEREAWRAATQMAMARAIREEEEHA